MDILRAMRVFRTVAERDGFSAASRTLGLSKASVSKQVSALENHLGVRLFNRTTRHLSLTEVGQGYLERVVSILGDVDEIEGAVRQQHANPCGTLRVNAPMSFGLMHLSPALCDFMDRYSDLTIDLTLNDRFVDVVDEGYDLAVRIGKLTDSSLIARKLSPARFAICAAPSYWAEKGMPTRPGDLADHACFPYTNVETPTLWRFTGPEGPEVVRVDGRLYVNNGQVILDAVRKGLGVGLFPTFMVGSDLRDGTLTSALETYAIEEAGVYAVYPPGRHLSAKVRVFVDFLVERFGGEPYWDHPAG